MKRIIAEENYSLAPLEVASLVKKSNDTGVPVKVIKEVYAIHNSPERYAEGAAIFEELTGIKPRTA